MYWVTRFDTVDLEMVEATEDMGLPRAISGAVATVGGGGYDAHGTGPAPRPLPWELRFRAELVRTTQPAMLAAWQDLAALYRKRATLYRTPDGGASNSQWVTARLMEMPATRSPEHVLYLPFELGFEVWSPCWWGTAHDDTTTLDASPKTIVVANGGDTRVENAILTVTAGSADITALEVAVAGVSKWVYSGTIAAGEALVVDCGAKSVKNNGVADYTHFDLDETGDHAIPDWLWLEPGNNSVVVTITGGSTDSTIEIAFSDGWA